VAANRVEALEPVEGGARVRDGESGEVLEIRAANVVNATGVWADRLRPAELHDEAEVPVIRPSRGTHLVFDAEAFGNPVAALTIPIPGELNRFVFAMPEQLGRVYLGLTDEDAPGPIPDVPQPTSAEVDFLLDTVNSALGRKLGRADVVGSYAGLRPLIDTGTGSTADVARDHAVIDAPSGAVSDGVRKSLCSRVPEVMLVPSETTVTTSVARRGAVSARLTRTGLTVGHETGAPVEDCDGVTPGVGVPEVLKPEPLEPGVVVAVQAGLVVVDEHGCGDVHRVHEAEAFAHAALRHRLGHAVRDVHEVHPRGHVHGQVDGVRFHLCSSRAARTASNTRVAISRLTPSRTVPQAIV